MGEPILKWAGGKRQMLDKIVPRLPESYSTYFEPFFGGGAVFFSLAPENGYINDINPRLMNFYKQIRDNPERIISENHKLDDEYAKRSDEKKEDYYYNLRKKFNRLRKSEQFDDEAQFREAVIFLFLNRTCWNGLYRTNENGEFNVPMGSKWTRVSAIESRIREAADILLNTKIDSKNFGYIRRHVESNDLVFLDPPYPGESETASFNEYHKGGFGREQQIRVRDLAIELHERGANVLITNGPSMMEIYTDGSLPEEFRTQEVYGQRMINSKSERRTGIGPTDILVTNIPSFGIQKSFDDFR